MTRRRSVMLVLCVAAVLSLCAPAADALAAKRDAYPPARLWYRITVDFDGLTSITEASGQPYTFEETWRLESRHAIRLTLMCVNVRSEFGTPFVWKERIKGRKRRVGGCPRRTRSKPRKNLRETVRFAATATGEITKWEHDDPLAKPGCPNRIAHHELVGSQPVTGQISSASSATDGLHVSGDIIEPLAPFNTTAPAVQCVNPGTGVQYEDAALAVFGAPFMPSEFMGVETYIGDELASEQLAARFPPARFGRDYSYTRRLARPEDLTRARVLAPAGPYYQDPWAAKDYTYTVRFEACPRRGRAVKRC